MSEVPRWLKVLAGAALLTLLVAVAKPAAAVLLLRALAVGVVGAMAAVAVAKPLHDVSPALEIRWRVDPRPPADLPLGLDAMGEALRTRRRGEPVPEVVLDPLRAALHHRLRHRHGVRTTRPEPDEERRDGLSPAARSLLVTTSAKREDAIVITRRELPDLIAEIESL